MIKKWYDKKYYLNNRDKNGFILKNILKEHLTYLFSNLVYIII